MTRPHIRIRRLTVWLWSGGWSWKERHLPCPHCRNFYIGPFGFEWVYPDQ